MRIRRLRDIDQELNDRYARHYRVRSMSSASEAREWLEELSAAVTKLH